MLQDSYLYHLFFLFFLLQNNKLYLRNILCLIHQILNLSSPSDTKYEYKNNYKPNSVFILKKTDLDKNKWFTIYIEIDKKFEYYIENIFSFRIRAPPKHKIDLISINSDQNILCNYDGQNFCYFKLI